MSNNQKLIGIFGVVIGGIAIIVFRAASGSSTGSVITPTPTPTPIYQEVDEGVEVTLEANAARTMVLFTLTGLAGRYSGIEYEVTYMTDNGPKGTLSGSRPIPLDSGTDEFSREVELGTCSTGGKCTYQRGVRNFKVFVKLHTIDDEVQVLKKEFKSV